MPASDKTHIEIYCLIYSLLSIRQIAIDKKSSGKSFGVHYSANKEVRICIRHFLTWSQALT